MQALPGERTARNTSAVATSGSSGNDGSSSEDEEPALQQDSQPAGTPTADSELESRSGQGSESDGEESWMARERRRGGREEAFLRLSFSDGAVLVLSLDSIVGDTQGVMSRNGVSHAMSADLRALLDSDWPCEKEEDGGEGKGQQKRRQRKGRRRLAVGR
ncbi:MAG: hypothetical protein WDW38_010771 [Sanguina aurantia]